ncbi:MAG: NYN domain-containing protein, partial [Pseudomonadota bacterium]
MSLHVIVDGYNFINASPSLAASLPQGLEVARDGLIARLAEYRRHRSHRVSAVFDGRKALDLPLFVSGRIQVKGVSVVFSRPGQEADDVIRNMSRQAGMKAVVVTADLSLAETCRRWGAAVVAPEKFEELMWNAEEDSAGEEDQSPARHKKGPARRAPRQERRQRLRTD